MVKTSYSCDLCGKVFNQKNDFTRHKNKKQACVPPTAINELQKEQDDIKKLIMTQKEHDALKQELTQLFKTCLNKLRDQEHLTGDKALRCIAYFLVLRLCEDKIDDGTIDIDNLEYYDTYTYEEDDLIRYSGYAKFSTLMKETKLGLVVKMKNLWDVILCKHPKFSDIFLKGESFRIKHDSTFYDLIKLIGEFQFENYEHDIQGEAYEEVIKDIMTGKVLGQFFTPPLIKKFMVDLIKPKLSDDGKVETIFDPAMGTGGFLITALRYYNQQSKENNIEIDWDYMIKNGVGGREAEPDTFQLCKANMLISSGQTFETIEHGDSIRSPISKKYDIVLTNPPFGIKGLKYDDIQTTGTITKAEYLPLKTNSAVPLFIQAIIYMLKIGGRCATVLPNGQELFGTDTTNVNIRKFLMKTCEVKEIVYMPGGVFNNTGIKTCVAYFYKRKEGKDIVKTNGNKIEFVDEHTTDKISFYDYDHIKDEKKLLIEVDMTKIVEKSYSLNYADYIEKEEEKYGDNIQIYKLGDVCEINFGKRIVKNQTKSGKYPVYGSGNPTFYTDTYNRTDWNILIGRFAVSENCVKIIKDQKIFLNDSGFSIESKNLDILIKKYIGYYLYLHQHDIFKCARGTAQKNMDMYAFKQLKIQVPPMETQKYIVEQLDFLYQTIETSERKIADLKRINGIIMENQRRYGENMQYKLGELCKTKCGAKINLQNFLVDKSSYGIIRTRNIGNFNESFLFIDEKGYELCKTCMVKEGDIVMSSFVESFQCELVPKQWNNYTFNGGVFRLNDFSNMIDKKYIIYYFKTPYFNNQLNKISAGTTVKMFNTEKLNNITIKYPSIERQKEIVEQLEKNDKLIQQLEEEINQNKALAKNILDNIVGPKKNNKTNDTKNDISEEPQVNEEIDDNIDPDEKLVDDILDEPEKIQEEKPVKKAILKVKAAPRKKIN